MHFERPITKKMKAQQEAERQARLNAEYAAALEKQRAEQQARLEQAKVQWEVLLKALPNELKRIEEILLNITIPEWEQKASAPIDWDQIEDPACSTAWELRFNQYERFDDYIPHYYESSDGMRSGVDTERVVRERMPGSYWVNLYSNKEHFISRAATPDAPIPPVQYPYCTIASDGEQSLWGMFDYPHDKARVDAIIGKIKGDQEYYRSRIEEARSALTGSAQERVKYLLNRPEADRVRNNLQKAWSILNPDKSKNLFWEDIVQAL